MAESKRELEIPNLPDEAEYPSELTERYELVECFADKEETRTLLAIDRESGRKCVVKCYLRESTLYDCNEPETLRGMDIDPIPRFLAEYRNEDMRCVLREYVPGETLCKLAERRAFTEEEVLEIGIQLCDQLDALHSQRPPVIHRDIKPQNIVIRPDGRAVLIDFGIARVQSDKETDTVAFGTQGFAPPEQYGYAQTDARSDIYSLGILLYWLLHRETKIAGDGNTALEKVIVRCAAFDPQKRYPDARQVKQALMAARPEAQKKKRLHTYAGIALAAVIAVIGIFSGIRAQKSSVIFREPLIEQAVRQNLGLDEKTPVTEELLGQVTGIYIVADAAYPNSDAFYPAINEWYARGDLEGGHGELRSLEDLAMMPQIEQVCIVAEELKSLSELESLTNINKVELKHNYLTDISALAGMDRLTYVGINDNPVEDLSPLTECPNLAFLDLGDVRNYDPSVIAQLGNFDYLDIANPTNSYDYLAGKGILNLRISWTGLSDLHVLDEVTRLERLEIDHTDVADLSPLALHTGLKSVRISALPVKDLEVLTQLPQLTEVTISEDMKPLVDELGEISFTVNIE